MVLQCSRKFVLFLLSISTLRRTISFDSQRRRLYDMNYVNMSNEIRVCTKRKFKNCNFSVMYIVKAH